VRGTEFDWATVAGVAPRPSLQGYDWGCMAREATPKGG
jgi:hypothetical protein